MKIKVLIVRFSSIGDIVLTTPIIRCLKEQLDGDVEIHFITKNKFSGIVESNPNISKVWGIEKKVSEVFPDLKQQQFHYIIDLHHNLRSRFVKKNVEGLPFTFKKLNFEKWLITNLKIDRLLNKHIVDRYFDAIAPLSIKNDHKGLEYYIPENDQLQLDVLPKTHQKGFIGFVIGGTYTTKQFPLNKVIETSRKISKPIVLLGGKTESSEGNKIVSMVGNNVYNACGKFNLNQSSSLVQQADKIITNDTGLMHIAAAFKKPILSIWGNTTPKFGMYPYLADNSSKIVELKDLNCRPCSKLGYEKCPKKHFNCMQLIDSDEIADWANS